MKTEQFADKLQRSLALRKLELSRLRLALPESPATTDKVSWLSRSAVLLSYSHWEGFVKESSKQYISLICSRQLLANTLHESLQAALLKSHFKRAEGTEKSGYLGTILLEMDAQRCQKFYIKPDKVIDTESNLSSVVFRDLIKGIGLDYLEFYETRSAFIDKKLLHARNQVAHGELVTFTPKDATDRINGTLELLDHYNNQLIDSARDESYLASAI